MFYYLKHRHSFNNGLPPIQYEKYYLETAFDCLKITPRVEYTLTDRGRDFLLPVEALVNWMVSEWPNIEVSRHEYDSKNQKSESTD